MLKVLVADDEQLERQALRYVMEQHCPNLEVVGLAANGREAISLARETNPDILFMDIKMPGIDGLKAIRVIRENCPRTKIVILSAYDEFVFAQEALKLGAIDYILKPARPQEVVEVVETLAANIFRERERAAQEARLRRELDKMMPFIQTAFVYDLIMGNIEAEEEIRERAEFFQLSLLPGAVLIIEIDHFASRTSHEPELNRQLLKKEVFQVVEKVLAEFPRGIVTTLGSDKLVLLFSPQEENNGFPLQKRVLELAERIRYLVAKTTGFTVTVGIGRFYEDLRDLHRSFGEAERAIQFGYFLGADQVIHIDDVDQDPERIPDYPMREERALVRWVCLGDEDAARPALERLLEKLLVPYPGQLEVAKARMLELLVVMSRAAVEGGAPVGEVSRLNLSYILELGRLQDSEEIRSWMNGVLEKFLAGVNSGRQRLRSQAVTRAKEYMEENFSRDISLEEISAFVNLSPYYFSRLFKQEEGLSFVEYLTRLRIEEAKRLLRSSQESIVNIALRVGYSEANYFSRVFRKLEGCTPSQYREGQG